MANFLKGVVAQVKKQWLSFVSGLTGTIFYVYNMFKPTSVNLSSQSFLGGGVSTVISLGAIALFLIVLAVVIFFVVKAKQKHKRRR